MVFAKSFFNGKMSATCFITSLEPNESSLVPAGFLTSFYCRKLNLWSLCCFFVENWLGPLFTAFLEERESIEKLNGWQMNLFSLFFFSIKVMKTISISVLPLKQRLHKLCFLQKPGCQKPCWDQAAPRKRRKDSWQRTWKAIDSLDTEIYSRLGWSLNCKYYPIHTSLSLHSIDR